MKINTFDECKYKYFKFGGLQLSNGIKQKVYIQSF